MKIPIAQNKMILINRAFISMGLFYIFLKNSLIESFVFGLEFRRIRFRIYQHTILFLSYTSKCKTIVKPCVQKLIYFHMEIYVKISSLWILFFQSWSCGQHPTTLSVIHDNVDFTSENWHAALLVLFRYFNINLFPIVYQTFF